MSSIHSYIQLVNFIENFAENHRQIRRFKAEFDEQLPNFATLTEAYPILFMSPAQNIYGDYDDRFVVNFYCFDVIQKDRENINTIYSDCSLILNDLKKFIKDGENYNFDIAAAEATVTPINNALLDYVAGGQMQLIISVDTYSYCEIPLEDGINIPTQGVDTIYTQYLTCDNVTGCTNVQTYVESVVQSYSPTYFSGGTIGNDTVINGGLTANTGYFTSLSAGTIYSGSTDLYDIFLTAADGNDITRVQPGTNITTGGTPNNPIVNLVDSPSVNNLTFSGTATGGNLSVLSASASTIYSGSTNLSTIINNAITDANSSFYIMLNFESVQQFKYISPEPFQILSYTNPLGLTLTVKKNGSTYTTGTTINTFDTLTVDVNATGYTKFNCIKV